MGHTATMPPRPRLSSEEQRRQVGEEGHPIKTLAMFADCDKSKDLHSLLPPGIHKGTQRDSEELVHLTAPLGPAGQLHRTSRGAPYGWVRPIPGQRWYDISLPDQRRSVLVQMLRALLLLLLRWWCSWWTS